MKTLFVSAVLLALTTSSAFADLIDCENPHIKRSGVGGSNVIYTTCLAPVFNSKLFTEKDRAKIRTTFDALPGTLPKGQVEGKYVWNFYGSLHQERNPQIGQRTNGIILIEGVHNYKNASCKEISLYSLSVVPMGDIVVMDKRQGLVIPPAIEAYRGIGYLCKNTKNPNFWETFEYDEYMNLRKAGKMKDFIPGGTESLIAGESEDPADATK
jgi:hypothetical protein